jgi:hypothetical protein
MKSMCLRVLLLVALIAASTGCNTASSLPVSATPTPPSTLVQNPLAPGKAGLTGRVVATEGDKPGRREQPRNYDDFGWLLRLSERGCV